MYVSWFIPHIEYLKSCILWNVGIECGEVGGILPPHIRVTIVSREVGGRAQFNCDPGFGIRGPHEIICLSSGEWATPYPTCVGTLIVKQIVAVIFLVMYYLFNNQNNELIDIEFENEKVPRINRKFLTLKNFKNLYIYSCSCMFNRLFVY